MSSKQDLFNQYYTLGDRIDYEELIKNYPWVIEGNANAIVSPDTDGFLCGLLMANLLGWKIKGYYDGKILLLEKGVRAKDCVFLDMDIYRENIRSIGHHMVMFNKLHLPGSWHNLRNCIQPNNIRNYDFYNDFPAKYPLATIHLLIGILGIRHRINIPKSAICPLLYVDGTFKNLFNYPANCLSWLRFLGADHYQSLLYPIFYNDHYSITELMVALKDLFIKLGTINNSKRGGDKMKISDSKGNIKSFVLKDGLYSLNEADRIKVGNLLILLSQLTGWNHEPKLWCFDNLADFIFSKSSIKPGKKSYEEMIIKNPLSFAITSTLSLGYTLEKPAALP